MAATTKSPMLLIPPKTAISIGTAQISAVINAASSLGCGLVTNSPSQKGHFTAERANRRPGVGIATDRKGRHHSIFCPQCAHSVRMAEG